MSWYLEILGTTVRKITLSNISILWYLRRCIFWYAFIWYINKLDNLVYTVLFLWYNGFIVVFIVALVGVRKALYTPHYRRQRVDVHRAESRDDHAGRHANCGDDPLEEFLYINACLCYYRC